MQAADVPYAGDGHEVLKLVLLNTGPWPAHTLCQLLSVSPAVTALVHATFPGTIELRPCTSQDLQQPGSISWITQHAVLLRGMSHADKQEEEGLEAAWAVSDRKAASEDVVAAFTATAAARPDGLPLQSLSTYSPVMAVYCSKLTRLQLGLDNSLLFSNVQETATALTGLSNLRTLKLCAAEELSDSHPALFNADGSRKAEPGCGIQGLLQLALPKMTSLTSLEVQDIADACWLRHAPPQLQELVAMAHSSSNVLELGHLTNLTRLEFARVTSRNPNARGFKALNFKDTLPPNLQVLRIVNCASVQPLLHLALQELYIGPQCCMSASEMQRLSLVTSLTHVELGYVPNRDGSWANAAEWGSAGWGNVPGLKVMALRRMRISYDSNLLRDLAALGVTRLVWHDSRLGGDDVFYRDLGLRKLGRALPQSLIELDLSVHLELDDMVDTEAAVVLGARKLKQALLALPHLETCTIDAEVHLSDVGVELVDMLLGVDFQQPVPDDWEDRFAQAYPDYADWLDDSDTESGSEEEEWGPE